MMYLCVGLFDDVFMCRVIGDVFMCRVIGDVFMRRM